VGRSANSWRTAEAWFKVAESTVSESMIRRRGPPSQTWRTFLRSRSRPPFCAGIGLDSGPTGAGNPTVGQGGRKSILICAISSD
jgi:hypothetical protein